MLIPKAFSPRGKNEGPLQRRIEVYATASSVVTGAKNEPGTGFALAKVNITAPSALEIFRACVAGASSSKVPI